MRVCLELSDGLFGLCVAWCREENPDKRRYCGTLGTNAETSTEGQQTDRTCAGLRGPPAFIALGIVDAKYSRPRRAACGITRRSGHGGRDNLRFDA